MGGSFDSGEDAMTALRQLNAFSDDGIQNVTVTPLRGGFLFEVRSALRPGCAASGLRGTIDGSIDQSMPEPEVLDGGTALRLLPRLWDGVSHGDRSFRPRGVLPAATLPVAVFVSFLSGKQSGRALRPSPRGSGADGGKSSVHEQPIRRRPSCVPVMQIEFSGGSRAYERYPSAVEVPWNYYEGCEAFEPKNAKPRRVVGDTLIFLYRVLLCRCVVFQQKTPIFFMGGEVVGHHPISPLLLFGERTLGMWEQEAATVSVPRRGVTRSSFASLLISLRARFS